MDLSDPTQFAAAYAQHGRGVYGAAYRIVQNPALAQDVAQDVFLRVWRDPKKFDARRGELGSYLRLMARSRALDLWREGQAAGRATDRMKTAVAQEPPREEDRPDARVARDDTAQAVRAAVGELPDTQREALVLAYWGGMTADEVARHVGVPLGTAKSRIRLGLTKLRDRIDEFPALAAA